MVTSNLIFLNAMMDAAKWLSASVARVGTQMLVASKGRIGSNAFLSQRCFHHRQAMPSNSSHSASPDFHNASKTPAFSHSRNRAWIALALPKPESDLQLIRRMDELHLEHHFAGARMLLVIATASIPVIFGLK